MGSIQNFYDSFHDRHQDKRHSHDAASERTEKRLPGYIRRERHVDAPNFALYARSFQCFVRSDRKLHSHRDKRDAHGQQRHNVQCVVCNPEAVHEQGYAREMLHAWQRLEIIDETY